MPVDELRETYEIHMVKEDREYMMLDMEGIPMFCAAMMTLFEGNQ